MCAKHVVVEPYNEAWKDDFIAIRDELAPALGDLALAIEHVGSTSVEGLSAKPIIDIDVVIESREKLPEVIELPECTGKADEKADLRTLNAIYAGNWRPKLRYALERLIGK